MSDASSAVATASSASGRGGGSDGPSVAGDSLALAGQATNRIRLQSSDAAGAAGDATHSAVVASGFQVPAPKRRKGRRARAAVQLSREQILETTAACLKDRGYDATTIRRIATDLDCAVGSIYRYFEDKRDLLTAVAAGIFEPVIERADAGDKPIDVLRLYLQQAHSDPQVYRLMFWLASVGDRPQLPAVIERMIDALSQGVGSADTARKIWAMTHGMVILATPTDEAISMIQPILGQAASAKSQATQLRITDDASVDANGDEAIGAASAASDVVLL